MKKKNIPVHYPSTLQLTEILSSSAADVDAAYYKLVEMKEKNEEISIVSLNCIIEACSNLKEMDRAIATFGEGFPIFPNILSPSPPCFNIL